MLLEIDLQGARQVKAAVPDAQFVFLAPPELGRNGAPAGGPRHGNVPRNSSGGWKPLNWNLLLNRSLTTPSLMTTFAGQRTSLFHSWG